ncbi:MAG: DUF3179 domain-containing protein [Dehalococcoidia bacterium]
MRKTVIGVAMLFVVLALVLTLVPSCGGGGGQELGVAPTPGGGGGEEPRVTPTPGAEEDRPLFSTAGWKTDFSKHSVPYSEIISGGVPRDGIPPIYDPKFESVTEAGVWLTDGDPVVSLVVGDQARAYPLRILLWHEIVNDEVAGIPVALTYCPLCNTAVAFDRSLQGKVYTFGVSGLLRNSDLVMWDHETESLWQQATGEAIVGELTGETLEFLSSSIVSWQDFEEAFPEGRVLSQDTGYSRSYGRNPYVEYDASSRPFLFSGELDPRLPALERVIGVTISGDSVAYPFSALAQVGVANEDVGGGKIVVFYISGTLSPLDKSSIEDSREAGSAAVFDRTLDDRTLAFEVRDGDIVDRETGSIWNIFGQATEGSLKGQSLKPIIHGTHFWFAWAAFTPETRIYQA